MSTSSFVLLAGETLALRAFLRARVTLVLSPGLDQ
jgi:hypothetical protein